MNTSTHETRPHLVIISGAPASGKSTLAERLSQELRYPLLAKDAVKELLADTWGALDHAGSQALGLASIRLLYDTASRLLGAGDDVIIESNFYRGISEPDLAPLVARSRAVLIHCQASTDIIMQRYVERDASGDRHAVHVHGDYLAALAPKLAAGVFEPPALGVSLVRVDTSDGYDPPLAEIIDRIRAGAAHGERWPAAAQHIAPCGRGGSTQGAPLPHDRRNQCANRCKACPYRKPCVQQIPSS